MSLSSLEGSNQSATPFPPPSEPLSGEKTAVSAQKAPATLKNIAPQATPPKVRFPMRLKITLPYALLALCVILAAAYIVTQLVTENVEERFTRQLIEVGQLTTDWMVHEEQDRLETLRLVVHTDGIAQSMIAGDSEKLRELVLPLAVNAQEEAIEVLTPTGVSLLSLHHQAGGTIEAYDYERGNDVFAEWPFVQNVLNQKIEAGQDKYSGAVETAWGNYFYIAGPILDSDGRLLGVVLVGKSLPTLVSQIRQETFAQITLYDFAGQQIASTLPFEGSRLLSAEETAVVATQQAADSLLRQQQLGSVTYTEILAPWEARGGEDMGIVGAALPQTTLVQASQNLRIQIFALTAAIFMAVITIGLILARRITEPLDHLVMAVSDVAEGNLKLQVKPTGKDEIAVLAYSFNNMLHNLREGEMYRDLLGRAVTPEVRDELRGRLESGSLRLEGETQVATVLFSDIRRFTTISEEEGADAIFELLNEYLGEVIPTVADANGIITEFAGDAFLALFGLLPRALDPAESAYQACQAALAMQEIIKKMNERRQQLGDPLFITGIGINTGEVAAGGIGTASRVHYTVIGDTVNTAQRLESFTKQFGHTTSIVISHHTLEALGSHRYKFNLEPLGAQQFKGKAEAVEIYRLSSLEPNTGRIIPNKEWSRLGKDND